MLDSSGPAGSLPTAQRDALVAMSMDSHAYGYLIAQAVMSRSDGYFELKEGSLYPALHRMERQKLLRATWSESDEGRRRKYYKLTPAGQKALDQMREDWARFSKGVDSVLRAAT